VQDRIWVSYGHAAERLNLSTGYVGWLGSVGSLEVERRGSTWRVSQDSLEQLVDERARWITLVEAGSMIGCSSKTAQALARRGLIHQRESTGSKMPSVSRASVESYVHGRREQRA
jgi:hypothetical protein